MDTGCRSEKRHTPERLQLAEGLVNQGSGTVVLTVGHSTRPLAEFTALLTGHSVSRLVDVRTVPRSRHNPQFNRDTLPAALEAVAIGYEHAPGLGGFRPTHPGSVNMGWQNASFRGFADYMQTPGFAENLGRLVERAKFQRIALMCAEAVPWRCHRSLIADALEVHGVRTWEIISAARLQLHKLTPFARGVARPPIRRQRPEIGTGPIGAR
jgi:uncharacterized protein (DUF488 family)